MCALRRRRAGRDDGGAGPLVVRGFAAAEIYFPPRDDDGRVGRPVGRGATITADHAMPVLVLPLNRKKSGTFEHFVEGINMACPLIQHVKLLICKKILWRIP